MPVFAVLRGDRVENKIVADSLEIAQEVTGKPCVEGELAEVGWIFDSELGVFRRSQPFESWILSEDGTDWVSPVPMPEDGNKYVWIEESQEWLELPEIVEVVTEQPSAIEAEPTA